MRLVVDLAWTAEVRLRLRVVDLDEATLGGLDYVDHDIVFVTRPTETITKLPQELQQAMLGAKLLIDGDVYSEQHHDLGLELRRMIQTRDEHGGKGRVTIQQFIDKLLDAGIELVDNADEEARKDATVRSD